MLKSIGEAMGRICGDMIGWVFSIFLNVGDTISDVASFKGVGSTVEGQYGGTVLNNIWTSLDGGVKSCIEALQPVGLALCMLFFIISLLELAMSERMTMEYFIKYLSKLVIGVAAVYYAPKIWEVVVEFGDALGNLVKGLPFSVNSSSLEDIQTQLSDGLAESFSKMTLQTGAAIWIGLMLVCFALFPIVGICGVGMTVVAYIVAFSRVLELCVRGVFLPIACSLLSDDGWRGAGGRYIRKILALSCQGAVLSIIGLVTSNIICLAGSHMVTDFAEVAFDGLFDCVGTLMGGFALILGVGFACISLMFKSIGLVNDVFGG